MRLPNRLFFHLFKDLGTGFVEPSTLEILISIIEKTYQTYILLKLKL